MKKEKIFEFKPKHLKKLSLEVEKLITKKEQEDNKIFKKIKKVLDFR